MPLIPAVEAFAQELGGTFGRRARRLAGMLTAGVPLPDALDRCPGLLPRYAEPAIHVGCETGTLAQALRRAATVYDRDAPMWLALQGKIAYLLLLPAFGGLLLTFIMLKIIPSFETIFKDYRRHAAAVDAGTDWSGESQRSVLVCAVAVVPARTGALVLSPHPLLWLDRLGPAGHGAVHAAVRRGRDPRHAGAGCRPRAAAAAGRRRPGPRLSQETHPLAAEPGCGRHDAGR